MVSNYLTSFLLCVALAVKVTTLPIEVTGDHSDTRVQLDSDDSEEELLFKPDTDERYKAAEEAIAGVKKSWPFQLDTFYKPEDWGAMLDDEDYKEMEDEFNRMKRIELTSKERKQASELDLDGEEDEGNALMFDNGVSENGDNEEDFDLTEAAPAVPVVHVEQVGTHPAHYENGHVAEYETSDNISSWMDIFDSDSDLAEEAQKQEQRKFDWYQSLFSSDSKEATSEGKIETSNNNNEAEILDRRKRQIYVKNPDDYSDIQVDAREVVSQNEKGNKAQQLGESGANSFDLQVDNSRANSESTADNKVRNNRNHLKKRRKLTRSKGGSGRRGLQRNRNSGNKDTDQVAEQVEEAAVKEVFDRLGSAHSRPELDAYLLADDYVLAKTLAKSKNRIAFDSEVDGFQFDHDGTIASAKEHICRFVKDELPKHSFTGKLIGGSECDVRCERFNGKDSGYAVFHLKNWPCGPDLKNRCSNDGKCESSA